MELIKNKAKLIRLVQSVITLFCLLSIGKSQTGFTFPHPDNNVLEKSSSNVGMDYSSGQLNLSIPLAEIASKSFKIGFSLNYANSGIKYQEYATSLGLGWNLKGGGKITRMVRAYPDDLRKGYLSPEQHGKAIENALLHNGYLHNDYYVNLREVIDGEPDLYYVETPFFAFQFTFDGEGKIVTNSETGIVVKHFNFMKSAYSVTNSYFVVVDASGNEYFFSSTLSNRDLTSEYFGGEKLTYTSCWHLDKIVDVTKSEIINFQYTKYGSNQEAYNYYSWYRPSDVMTSEMDTYTQSFSKVYLTKVTTKYGNLRFTYFNDRLDVENGAPKLVGISAYHDNAKNTFVRGYSFDYSYFGSTSSSPNYKLSDRCRLRLDGIKVATDPYGHNSEIFKSFEYLLKHEIYDRKQDRSDYLGYYTKFQAGADPMHDPTLRQPYSVEWTGNAQLFKVIERNGAYNEIKYEHNTFNKDPQNKNYILGGLRVKGILMYESPGGDSTKRLFDYSFDGASSGIVHNTNYDEFSYSFVQRNPPNHTVFTTFFSSSVYVGNTSLWSYSKVKEKFPNNSSIQYEYDFYCDSLMDIRIRDNYVSSSAIMGVYNSNVQGDRYTKLLYRDNGGSTIDQSYKRTSPNKVTLFNSDNHVVRESIFQYEALGSKKAGYGLRKQVIKMSSSQKVGAGQNAYYTLQENWRLTKETQKDYSSDGSYAVTENKYQYHPNKFLVRSTQSKDSKGATLVTTKYYPEDGVNIPMINSTEQTVLSTMVNSNLRNIVIHESNSIENRVVNAGHNSFSGDFTLTENSQYRLSTSSQNLVKVTTGKIYYDTDKRPIMSIKNTGQTDSYGFDSFDRPVVQVTNAMSKPVSGSSANKYFEFFYEGFEDLTFPMNYAGLGSRGTPYTVPFVIPNGRKYLIDYHYLDQSSNKWKYEKKAYTNGMVITNGSRVDEIRIYPEDAQISTYTYDEFGLKRSETGSNGNSTFFEYDHKNRLVLILDQDRNILKSYCYNTAGENFDCYGTVGRYKNERISQHFLKNDCPTGQEAIPIVYTVEEGKYKSTISQSHANLLAQADINENGQQYANTYGECQIPTDCLKYEVTITAASAEANELYISYLDCDNSFQLLSLSEVNHEYINDYKDIVITLCVKKTKYPNIQFCDDLGEEISVQFKLEKVGYCN